jgi:Plasmid encoded RepA protein
MAEVHRLIIEHGRERAREMVPPKQRHLVDVAAEVMATDQVALGITYSGWCLTALPHKRIPGNESWSRTGYNCTLIVEPGHLQVGSGKPRLFGVPYGARARLILLYLQTEAVRSRSREVSLGRSMRDWMTRMGLSIGGETAKGLRDQAHRIAAANIKFFWKHDEAASGMARGNIVESGLFFGSPQAAGQPSLFEDRVLLGEAFYEDLLKRGVPLLDQAIKQLRDRSMALDVYIWLAYKLHVLEGRTPIRWPALYSQFGAGFSALKNFKPSFVDAVAAAVAAYPDAQVRIEDDGIVLLPSSPPIPYKSGPRPRRLAG